MTTYISLDISLNSPNTISLSVTGFIGKIDWGDGEVITYSIPTSNPTKTYSNSGLYTIKFNDVIQLNTFGSSGNNSVYTNNLINFSYLIQIPTLTNLSNLFYLCNKNFTINFTTNVTSNVTSMFEMFRFASNFNQPINLNTQNVTNMYGMFGDMSNFNSTINFNDTSKVTNMGAMFYNCTLFNQDISLNTINVTNMDTMFLGCSAFNKPVSFNTSKVTSMQAMFRNCTVFNSSLNFDTTYVTNMTQMFYECTAFNQPLNFNTDNVINMREMFRNCTAFNQPLNFNTQNVTSMFEMFRGALNFNQPINFNTQNVTNMFGMFGDMSNFNSTVNFNDTSKVTNMSAMFYNCIKFNQDVSLNTINVTNMESMFYNCTLFNQPLNLTPIPDLTNATNLLLNSGVSIANYSNLLILWGSQIILKPNVTLSVGSIKYNSAAQPYRNILTSAPNNWTITDGGLSSGPLPTITSVIPSSCTINTSPTVVITGTNLNANTIVQFDYNVAIVSSISGTQITCTAPSMSTAGTVSLKVTTDFGQATIPFTYNVPVAPTITDFSIQPKTYTDAPFTITPPTSNSSGSFSYISSDTSVATISGDTLTITGIGNSVITAIQAATTDYTTGSITTTFISNICFLKGTPITTDQGEIAIEKINPEIHTIRNKKIVGITKTKSTDNSLICIEKNALGNNIPSKKTIITKDHCIFYNGRMRRAVELINFSSDVYKIKYSGEILYNVLMEEHEKMLVNNLICETLNPINPAAKLYKKIQKLSPDKQEETIKEYNDFIIKNNNFSNKQLNRLK